MRVYTNLIKRLLGDYKIKNESKLLDVLFYNLLESGFLQKHFALTKQWATGKDGVLPLLKSC